MTAEFSKGFDASEIRRIRQSYLTFRIRDAVSPELKTVQKDSSEKRGEGDNPTIGILLCTETDKTIARYSVLNENRQLFASKHLPFLPTEEKFAAEIDR